ncbi:TPA: tRNA-uridine aminocarboxypropyltransferase [Vibrio alginolyticus]|uniref:tRNA-uridine aminocarboxypropyltransferase n=1 Tax=Vibrio alginolyticus TaxID=663 RepID=A0AA36US86_VIBAL|nr:MULTISPECIES: tRNA-uridine aminocarboxypropyltransferase [Vibrio]EGQ8156309.1 DTW domain-containing protein [Vibrio alginolyticus]EGQ9136579.1 DTW domain-containing protein [Vibrio alginolyticus]EGQ9233199.1 DTW domain-containing protein [Vibrio alginolyticus]EGR1298527.1 DTW domain-containing protein [Vibrio alginolyticus]EGR2557923.1 DTW domain-containing protein [Vibrio alginolyticus]
MSQPCPTCGFQFNCMCSLMPKLTSEHNILLLMHPNELKRDTNTGQLLEQCQLNIERVIWDRKQPPAELLSLLADPSRYPVLLFPCEESITLEDVVLQSQQQTKTPLFIILDATWQEARKMINKSRWLEGIPTMGLSASADSQYQLRRNQQQGNLCTFEVAAHLLGQLGEQNNQQQMQRFFAHYLALFQAEKSGHALKR